jgi:hypothetical protein
MHSPTIKIKMIGVHWLVKSGELRTSSRRFSSLYKYLTHRCRRLNLCNRWNTLYIICLRSETSPCISDLSLVTCVRVCLFICLCWFFIAQRKLCTSQCWVFIFECLIYHRLKLKTVNIYVSDAKLISLRRTEWAGGLQLNVTKCHGTCPKRSDHPRAPDILTPWNIINWLEMHCNSKRKLCCHQHNTWI